MFHLASRLSERTRFLAKRGLSGEFGRQMVNAEVKLEEYVPAEGISEEMRYALAVKLIAETIPLRILPDKGQSTH